MLKCWLFGHKPLLLNALDRNPLITVYENYRGVIYKSHPIVEIHMCERCKYIYWIPAI